MGGSLPSLALGIGRALLISFGRWRRGGFKGWIFLASSRSGGGLRLFLHLHKLNVIKTLSLVFLCCSPRLQAPLLRVPPDGFQLQSL